jgi:SAM-dependent methyltransferase
VNKSQRQSLSPSYFEELYSTHDDPWNFETSEYEARKYQATLAVLPKTRYRAAFEIGCSIGVLTARLAERCDSLLSVDVSQKAMERAIRRCQSLPQVCFRLMRVPQEFPNCTFDLILVSEVGYYWSWEDLEKARQLTVERLERGGHLLLVHWTLYARDYPLSGDEVHEYFLKCTETDSESASYQLRHLSGWREEQYRLDLFERL